tara:strand:- start:1602 stop:1877 length:276 start_codon:yes stop_codon:yes gene_type:complete
MIAELAIYVALVALLINLVSLWAVNRVRSDQIKIVKNLSGRLSHIETILSHYEMMPLPWEIESPLSSHDTTKKFKQEGNVVYLEKEEQNER